MKTLSKRFSKRLSFSLLGGLALAALAATWIDGRANAATCIGHYTVDATSGIVTDNDTGLVWERSPDGTAKTWDKANADCEGLSLGGYDDWRLPTPFELQTIVDESLHAPAIDTSVFKEGGAALWGDYWSTKSEKYAGFAWVVVFKSGTMTTGGEATIRSFINGELYRVRCVR